MGQSKALLTFTRERTTLRYLVHPYTEETEKKELKIINTYNNTIILLNILTKLFICAKVNIVIL